MPNKLEPPDVTLLIANPLVIAPPCPVGAAKGELGGYLGGCEIGAGAADPTTCSWIIRDLWFGNPVLGWSLTDSGWKHLLARGRVARRTLCKLGLLDCHRR